MRRKPVALSYYMLSAVETESPETLFAFDEPSPFSKIGVDEVHYKEPEEPWTPFAPLQQGGREYVKRKTRYCKQEMQIDEDFYKYRRKFMGM